MQSLFPATLDLLRDLGKNSPQGAAELCHLVGATPASRLATPRGLSSCCYGERPHAVGWRFITERRAVNLDPNCGWARGKADALYVAAASAVMRNVNQVLGEQ